MNKIIKIIIPVLILVIAGGISGIIYYYYSKADSDEITIPPEVRVSDELYSYYNLGDFWDPPVLDHFEREYGPRYSEKLRQRIITNMSNQAKDLGEDPIVLEKCIAVADEFSPRNAETLPCLAEKARFEYYLNYTGMGGWDPNDINSSEKKGITPCWIIVFNWGYRNEDFGHVFYMVISSEDYTYLYSLRCT